MIFNSVLSGLACVRHPAERPPRRPTQTKAPPSIQAIAAARGKQSQCATEGVRHDDGDDDTEAEARHQDGYTKTDTQKLALSRPRVANSGSNRLSDNDVRRPCAREARQ